MTSVSSGGLSNRDCGRAAGRKKWAGLVLFSSDKHYRLTASLSRLSNLLTTPSISCSHSTIIASLFLQRRFLCVRVALSQASGALFLPDVYRVQQSNRVHRVAGDCPTNRASFVQHVKHNKHRSPVYRRPTSAVYTANSLAAIVWRQQPSLRRQRQICMTIPWQADGQLSPTYLMPSIRH